MAKNSSLPSALPISDALAQSAPLAHLRSLLRMSAENFASIRAVLPPALLPHVKPGPVDSDGWTVLADNVAVSAKLRQLLPRFEAALLQRDGKRTAIRVRVQSAPRV